MKKALILTAAALLMAAACTKEPAPSPQDPGFGTKSDGVEGYVVPGKQLTNIYSVQFMEKAAKLYCSQNGITPPSPLQPTHSYIRLMPNNPAEMDAILNDTSLILFPYPLDRELSGTGEFLVDTTHPQVLYTVVPYGYNPGCPHDIIDLCFIPPAEDEPGYDPHLTDIERFAYQMAGYELPQQGELDTKGLGGKPEGTISVFNTETGAYEGVAGIKVVFNSLVRVRSTTTDAFGHYACGTRFFMNLNYTLFFNNKDRFMIWKGINPLFPFAMGLGVHHPSGYSYNMNTNSAGWRVATVNNAIYTYIHNFCGAGKLARPPEGMRIALMNLTSTPLADMDWTGCTPMFRNRVAGSDEVTHFACNLLGVYGFIHFILPDVFIFKNSNSTLDMYSTVIHEMAHASHYAQVGPKYWMHYVTQIIMNIGYGEHNNHNQAVGDNYIGLGECWGYATGEYLTHLVKTESWNLQDQQPSFSNEEWFMPSMLLNTYYNVDSCTPYIVFQALDSTTTDICSVRNYLIENMDGTCFPQIISNFSPLCE